MTDKTDKEEFEEMARQLDGEVVMLIQALDGHGGKLEDDYAEKVMRSQLEEIGDLVESMTHLLGSGEAISVTKPSELEGDE